MFSKRKWIGLLAGLAMGFIISFLPVRDPSREALIALGILAGAVCFWVADVLPDYMVALLMCTLWIVTGIASFKDAFGAFNSTTFWLLFGAFAICAAVSGCGLLKRIALWIIRRFPANYRGQTAAMLFSGFVVAPLIPSSTAKAVLAGAIGVETARALGYEPYGKPATGLFLSTYMGYGQTGPIFQSACVISFLLKGTLPAHIQESITWLRWFESMLVWAVVFLAGSYVSLLLLYGPKLDRPCPRDYIEGMIAELGPLRREEKITAAILFLCLLLWITEPITGIDATVTALLAAVALCFAGVLGEQALLREMQWGLLIFVGAVLGMGNVFSLLGVNEWLIGLLRPVVSSINNPLPLFLAVAALTMLARCVVASMSASLVLFMAILSPVVEPLGINPFVVGIVVYTSMQIFFLKYQNVSFLPALAQASAMVRHGDTVKMSAAYAIVSLIGIALSIPYWSLLGFM
ncbi:MAG: anion permease [Clostridiales Family XIII bacterium]|jgi:DASS family divalent anion:Na+ symporter|nr:anion permease [Clostridiales Family XIII bacterium]